MKSLKIALLAATLTIVAHAAWARQTILWLESVSHDCTFAPDDTIRLNIRLDSNNNAADNIGMGFYYYGVDFTFIRAERGNLIAGWPNFQATVGDGPSPGMKQLNIDASGPTPIPPGVSGYMATVVFVFNSCGPSLSEYHFQICWAQLWGDFDESVTDIDERCGYIDVFPKSTATGRLTVETLYHTCNAPAADTVDVDIRLDQTTQAIDAAGVDIPYDPVQVEYVGFKRGDLTAAWPFFDVAVVAGKIRIGGFTTNALPAGTTGVFATLRFVMHCCGSTTITNLCTQSLVDDFVGMTAGCGSLHCTPLATQPASWGYVKSLYRR